MAYNCFYCDYEINEDEIHFVSFFNMNQEHEQTLCAECYAEWLEGIKE